MKLKSITYLVISLLIIGLIFISVSSLTEAAFTAGDKFYFIKKQLIWSALGLASYFIATKINLTQINQLSFSFFYLTLFLLLLLFLPNLSSTTLGAKRWLDLGIFGIQPSELVKLSTIFYFSSIFSNQRISTSKN